MGLKGSSSRSSTGKANPPAASWMRTRASGSARFHFPAPDLSLLEPRRHDPGDRRRRPENHSLERRNRQPQGRSSKAVSMAAGIPPFTRQERFSPAMDQGSPAAVGSGPGSPGLERDRPPRVARLQPGRPDRGQSRRPVDRLPRRSGSGVPDTGSCLEPAPDFSAAVDPPRRPDPTYRWGPTEELSSGTWRGAQSSLYCRSGMPGIACSSRQGTCSPMVRQVS